MESAVTLTSIGSPPPAYLKNKHKEHISIETSQQINNMPPNYVSISIDEHRHRDVDLPHYTCQEQSISTQSFHENTSRPDQTYMSKKREILLCGVLSTISLFLLISFIVVVHISSTTPGPMSYTISNSHK